MRRSTSLLSAIALATVALGGIAADEPEPKICAELAYAPALTTDGLSTMVDAPNYLIDGAESTDLYFTVDLGPDAYEDTVGTIAGEMTWDVVANDYDLSVNGNLSDNYQPFDAAVESASASVTHCDVVTVSAIDFLAPAELEELALELTVTRTN